MSTTQKLLEMRLKKFLHYGSELPLYMAGDRFSRKCYDKSQVPSLLKLMDELDEPDSIVDIIVEVKNSEMSIWPDSLTFALAVCCILAKDKELQHRAYLSLRTVCRTGRDILLFVNFCRNLKGKEGKLPGGNGFKRALAQWYLVWMPFDLANIFLTQRSYFGLTHADVIKIAHIKPISLEQQVLFTYMVFGLEKATDKFSKGGNEEVTELLEYISTVESFRKLRDPGRASKALATELHDISRVPHSLLRDQEVWNELIPHMDVQTLLDNLQRISTAGFLKNNNVTVMKVVDVFNNLSKAENFTGHPSRVYIELMTYEKAAKHCLDIASKLNHPISKITPARKPPKVNLVIKNALTTFFHSLYKFRKPTEKRYLVAVDLRPKLFTDRCYHCQYLTPVEAAQVVTLSLIRVEGEGNVTVGAFDETGEDLNILELNKKLDIGEYETIFEEAAAKAGPASVASAILWAEAKKKPVDMFVILSNYTLFTRGTRLAINMYRTNMKLPNTKVVSCSLSGQLRTHKDVEGLDMMSVVGFDEHLCNLIEAFARSAF